MKRIINVLAALFFISASSETLAQTSTELIFKNPTLVSGEHKMIGATYRFQNVANGTDALLTIASASQTQQLVNNIDLTEFGWDKAFQPEIGKSANVPANQEWWVRFNLKFVHPNTITKKKLAKFYATAMDVDGDNYVIAEYIQMYNPDSVKYRSHTQLTQRTPFDAALSTNSKTNLSQGPIQNYTNIDTGAMQVMVTYTFINTDEIDFVYGAKVGNGISNAGLRLNSLWFRSFNLNSNSPLPFRNNEFVVMYDKKNVTLDWKALPEDFISSFEIEKSTDGIKFQSLGQLKSSDNITSYRFTDANVSSNTGIIYYRILYREKTGEGKYSSIKIVRLNKDASSSITVYPNPVSSVANLTLPQHWQNKPVLVSIYNASGVLLKNINIRTASQTESLDFQHFSRGIYVVKAQCNQESSEQRILRN